MDFLDGLRFIKMMGLTIDEWMLGLSVSDSDFWEKYG